MARQIAKMVRILEVQQKLQMFDSLDSMSILSFPLLSQMAYDKNKIYEDAAMWLFYCLMTKPAGLMMKPGGLMTNPAGLKHAHVWLA